MNRNLMLERAHLAGQWALANQPTSRRFADGGRYTRAWDKLPHDQWRTLFDHGRTFVHLRMIAYSTGALAMLGGHTKRTCYNVSCAE